MSTVLSVPHQRQLADGFCLPACVQMVLAYSGINREQNDLAAELQTIPGAGTSGNRLRALVSKTLDVFYGPGELADLQAALKRKIPPIALVYTAELPYWPQATAHAVVVVGIEPRAVFLNDPGMPQSPLQVSRDEFLLAWDEMANLYALLTQK